MAHEKPATGLDSRAPIIDRLPQHDCAPRRPRNAGHPRKKRSGLRIEKSARTQPPSVGMAVPIADDYFEGLAAFAASIAPGVESCYVCARAIDVADDAVPLTLDDDDCLTSDPQAACGFRAHSACLSPQLATEAQRCRSEWRARVIADGVVRPAPVPADDARLPLFSSDATVRAEREHSKQ